MFVILFINLPSVFYK